MADRKLLNHTQSSSHCLSHLLQLEKHHLHLHASEDMGVFFPYTQTSFVKTSLILWCIFHLLWSVCLTVSGIVHCLTFAFVICSNSTDLISTVTVANTQTRKFPALCQWSPVKRWIQHIWAFCSSGPASWNFLPVHLRHPDLTNGAFRQQLKTILFVWVSSLCRITVLV